MVRAAHKTRRVAFPCVVRCTHKWAYLTEIRPCSMDTFSMVTATKRAPYLTTTSPLAPGVMLWTFGAQEHPRAPRESLTMCTPTQHF